MSGNDPLVDLLLQLAGTGGEWVLWLLIGLSVWASALIVERLLYFRRLLPTLDDHASAARRGEQPDAGEDEAGFELLLEELRKTGSTAPTALDARIESFQGELRRDLLRRTGVLGTLGANTPFIGLLGTVLGIIEAFGDLAEAGGRGSEAVMAGISEALVATGLGLLVAIPCVLAYNYFLRRSQRSVDAAGEAARLVAFADPSRPL